MARTIGNLCLGLAVLLYAIPLPLIIVSPPTHDGGQSEAWALIFLFLLLWFCLMVALCVSTANGGLDWLSIARGSQYALVVATSIAMVVVTVLSGLLRHESADQIPWVMRPLVPFAWAMWFFPLAVMIFSLFTVNPGLGAEVPRMAVRAPVGLAGGMSLLVSFGMLAQWFISSQQKQAARVDALVNESSERTKRQMEEVRALDANTQLNQILGYTNRYNDAELRELALQKVHAVPDLEEQLATGLRSPWYEYVLIFLDAADPPDGKALAEPARDAFLLQVEAVHERMKEPSYVHPDDFDFQARLMLSVADKFHAYGVDYAPAIRAFRTALDDPHDPKNVKFNCAADLDAWLARDANRKK
jgi:hypothetical protein